MTILVTGATGNVGRLVVDELLALGATNVRALTVDPARAALPSEVEVVEGYLGRPETLPAALKGVETMYLAPLPRTVKDVVVLAKEAGVRSIVDLSSSNADAEAAGDPAGWHFYAVERAVEESGLAWTHLRPGEFMSNTLLWADGIKHRGEVRTAYPTAASAPIDLGDIAAVAAKVLLEPGHTGKRHTGKRYELTGPETLQKQDLVRIIGETIGRDIRFVELDHDECRAELFPIMGEPADWYLDGLAELAANPQPVSPWVGDLTGRPGITFADWVSRNRHAFLDADD